MVICGFSGIGKSTLSRGDFYNRSGCIDLESSNFSHHGDGTLNDEFPANYIDTLEKVRQKHPYHHILLSCHQAVRDELRKRNIDYLIVLPESNCRNEYVKRWINRGSNIKFINNMYAHWHDYINSCIEDPAAKVFLTEGEYISDIINPGRGM